MHNNELIPQVAIEVSLIKCYLVIKQNIKKIFIFTGIVMLCAIIYALIATPIFTADTIINPPQLSDSGSGLAGSLGSFVMLSKGAGGFMKTDEEITASMLQTREVQDQLVKKFNLIKHYKVQDLATARSILAVKTKLSTNAKNGFVTISVDDEVPSMACQLANYYVVALGNLISRIGFDKAVKNRGFYEQQMLSAHLQVDDAKMELNKFSAQNGITAGVQTNIATGISTQLQSQLIAAQSQLQSMQQYATPSNPDYQRTLALISSLKSQIIAISGTKNNTDDVVVPANVAPILAQKYAELVRQLAFREEVYRTLLTHYEISKIDAMSDQQPVVVQVIDSAVVPNMRSKPRRSLIVFVSMILGILAASLYFIIRNRNEILVRKLN